MSNNKKLYKDTFDSLQMSDESLRKVRNMSKNEKRKRIFKVRYATVMAAIVALFVVSNGVAYAATGSTIVEHVANNIKVIDKNGENVDVDVTKENGNVKYKFKGSDGSENVLELPESDGKNEYDIEVKDNDGEIDYVIKDDSEKESAEMKIKSE